MVLVLVVVLVALYFGRRWQLATWRARQTTDFGRGAVTTRRGGERS